MEDIDFIQNYYSNPDENSKFNNVLVECGANVGKEPICKQLENIYKWKYYGIEPIKEHFEKLTKAHPNGVNYQVAISNISSEKQINNLVDTGFSSLTLHPTFAKYYDERGEIIKKTYVKTLTWNDYIALTKLEVVDFLIVDTEGHEKEVFEGFKNATCLPKIICTEFGMSDRTSEIKKNEENFDGIILINTILKKYGYTFDYVKYNNAYFSHNSFWRNKQKPLSWFGEDSVWKFWDTVYYDKDKLKNILK